MVEISAESVIHLWLTLIPQKGYDSTESRSQCHGIYRLFMTMDTFVTTCDENRSFLLLRDTFPQVLKMVLIEMCEPNKF